MPIIIKSAKIVDILNSDTRMINLVKSEFGYKDWFKVGNLEVFNQNLKKVSTVVNLNKKNNFGLNSNRNKSFTEIEISY